MSFLTQLTSLLCAGAMMVSSSLGTAAPQNDVSSHLILVNRTYRISKDYVPSALREAEVPGQVRRMVPEAATALESMYAACKAETGVTLTSVSGYRSYSKQSTIYNNKLSKVKSKAKADEYVARPGASEHQLGLAMDVGQKGSSTGLSGRFGLTEGGKWIAANCWRFGFILRYQAGWEDITGYSYEPWHVRYVGLEQAQAIFEANVPFETYMLAYREAVLTRLAGAK